MGEPQPSRLAQLAGLGVGSNEQPSGLFGLGMEALNREHIIKCIPKDDAGLMAVLFDIRAELAARYGEAAAQTILSNLAKPLSTKAAHRPKGATANADENAALLKQVDARLLGGGAEYSVGDAIRDVADEHIRSLAIRDARERVAKAKNLRERITYHYKGREAERAKERAAMTQALFGGLLGFGLGAVRASPPDVAALIEDQRKKPD